MPAPPLLTAGQIDAALAALPGWQGDTRALRRTVRCATFPGAIELVTRIADIAEELDHHPDIDIRWRDVGLALNTHVSGGVTGADTVLATRLQPVLDAFVAAADPGTTR